jgi:hypothetical protein
MAEGDGATKRLNVELPALLHRQLKMQAAAEGTSITQLMIEMLERLLPGRAQPHPVAAEGPPLTLAPGATVALDEGMFLHRCGRCRGLWLSASAAPAKCPRQRADARGPKCGTRQWRQTGEEPPSGGR